jgi:hypothetical protein
MINRRWLRAKLPISSATDESARAPGSLGRSVGGQLAQVHAKED